MDWITAAAAARADATVHETKTKRIAAWHCWDDFLFHVDLTDQVFLDGFTSFQRNILLSAFAQAVREASFSRQNKEHLVQSTVEATLSYVAQAFRASNRQDPRLDLDGKTCFLIQEQWRGYKNKDKNRKKQKALPDSVFQKMHALATSDWDVALSYLFIMALFFAMRSCEYLETRYPEESRRTKVLRCKNFKFKKDGKMLPLSSPLHLLQSADLVIITFEFQKNDWRNHSVHLFASTDHLLCPVKAAAFSVNRVLKIPGATLESKTCTVCLPDGKITYINSAQALPKLSSRRDHR